MHRVGSAEASYDAVLVDPQLRADLRRRVFLLYQGTGDRSHCPCAKVPEPVTEVIAGGFPETGDVSLCRGALRFSHDETDSLPE